jgi:endoglucanase
MKGTQKTPIDIRFLDTKENESDHPWRIRYTLDSINFVYDGTWQHVRLPLKNFKEHGSWDNNTWYNPEGKFNWAAVDRLEFDSEYGNMGSAELWFDEIKIINPDQPLYIDNTISENNFFQLSQNYPNPFNPSTIIKYNIAHTGFVTLKVYDILGNEMAVLVSGEKNPGAYEVNFNASSFPSGVYFCRLNAESSDGLAANYQAVKKLMLVK